MDTNKSDELNVIGVTDNHVQCYQHDTYYMTIPNTKEEDFNNDSYRVIVDIRSLNNDDQFDKGNHELLERLSDSVEPGYIYIIPIIPEDSKTELQSNDRKKANYISGVINKATNDIRTSEKYQDSLIEPVINVMSSDNSEEEFVDKFHHFFENRTMVTKLEWLEQEKEIHKPKILVKEKDDAGFANYKFLFISSAVLIAIYILTIFSK